MRKIGGAHFQCVSNHYAKFEYKEIKNVGITHILHIVSTPKVV